MTIDQYAADLIQEVLADASLDGIESTTTDAFTQLVVELLSEAGELNDGAVCYHAAHGIEVSGYSISDDGFTIDLFTSEFRQDPSRKLVKSEVDAHFKRLVAFAERCSRGYHDQVEEASPVFDMALDVEKALAGAQSIRCYMFSTRSLLSKAHIARP